MSDNERITDPATIRAAWDEDADRLVNAVYVALNSGRDKAVVQVVLDETDRLRRELAEAQSFLEQRSEALNRTGRQNDELRAAARAVVKADDDSVSYEPCAQCLRAGVALLEGESYDRSDVAIEALRAALGES